PGGRADHLLAVRLHLDAAAQAARRLRQGRTADGPAREPGHRRAFRGVQGPRRAGPARRHGSDDPLAARRVAPAASMLSTLGTAPRTRGWLPISSLDGDS